MSGVVAVTLFAKDSSRLFFSVNSAFSKFAYDVELFVHCSLDIVDDKLPKTTEMYLGHLFGDQKFKSFGYVTNSGVRMLLVFEATNLTIKDQDVRTIFRRLHAQYCTAIANPFYTIGSELESRDVIKLQMDEGFSGVVRISNISDFIAPNLNCIIPLEENTVKQPTQVVLRKKEGVPLNTDLKNAIKISLNDCLACNGCITSAETVLVQEQSLDRLLGGIKDKALSVVTVSPQSVCSIAAKRGISASEAAKLIASFFFSKGVTYVIDSSFGRYISLDYIYKEFMSTTNRPLLASSCPGFVCYAEKTHGKLLTPLISRTRSPQAVQGALVKDFLAKKNDLSACSIFHATVMPCFDKKLEASRPDFLVPGTNYRETDCVISSAELEAVLPSDLPEMVSIPAGWLGDFARGRLIGQPGASSSGGYADLILRRFIEENGGSHTTHNIAKDLKVTEVQRGEEVSLRVARVYGFRNIQNLVRKLKIGKCNYDFVEVMACPSGCSNGGGQLRAETVRDREETLKKVEELYQMLSEDSSEEMLSVLTEWKRLNPSHESLLMTDYHVVDTNVAQNLQW